MVDGREGVEKRRIEGWEGREGGSREEGREGKGGIDCIHSSGGEEGREEKGGSEALLIGQQYGVMSILVAAELSRPIAIESLIDSVKPASVIQSTVAIFFLSLLVVRRFQCSWILLKVAEDMAVQGKVLNRISLKQFEQFKPLNAHDSQFRGPTYVWTWRRKKLIRKVP
jgi:hypothetical protein